jgi:myo-inositol-1(or 4)-monophosphatase
MPAPLSPRSLFAIRSPHEGNVPQFVQRWLTRYRVRRFGSTALHLCYVALGALGFVHDHQVALWDIAGAVPVLLEAGGLITGPDGGGMFPLDAATWGGRPFAFLAGNPLAHGQALQEMRA